MGYIHSIQTFGTVDGPGVRFVVFFQGCPMRCQYCHNPDTWNMTEGKEKSVDEILEMFERNRTFYRTGGITATGGEPMVQMDFLLELFTKAKEKEIHTCLDTSGITFQEAWRNPENRVGDAYEKIEMEFIPFFISETGEIEEYIFINSEYIAITLVVYWNNGEIEDIVFQ